ncbi:hypothetical protein ACIRD3_19165 [Kitasatospora sp. NPDC093550]|uniref:hypothetical protein n=1 Tax=Kitasatospora sp. NPDC093550 TaxID=3364089 RepID=UPI00382ADE1D
MTEEVEDGGGDARARLDRLFTITAAADGPARGVALELAVRDRARREDAVAERLRRVDNRRMEYLRSLFGSFCSDEQEVEPRCMLTSSIRLGSHLLAAGHGALSRVEVMEPARKRLLP